MHKNTIIVIILFRCISFLHAQSVTDSLLFELEMKIYKETNHTAKTELLLQKLSIYFNQNNIANQQVLNELERVEWALIKDTSILSSFFWNSSLAYFLNEKYQLAINSFNHYEEVIKNDTSIDAYFFKALITINVDSVKFNECLKSCIQKDSSFIDMRCFYDVVNYEKKYRNAYLVSSAVIPGSGMLMLGKPRQGFTSLIINSASAYAVYALIQSNLYVNSIFWGIMLAQKFYVGGIKLTNKLFDEKEMKKQFQLSTNCRTSLDKLLLKYPLNFR